MNWLVSRIPVSNIRRYESNLLSFLIYRYLKGKLQWYYSLCEKRGAFSKKGAGQESVFRSFNFTSQQTQKCDKNLVYWFARL